MSFPLNQPLTLTFRTFSDPAQTVPADPTDVNLAIKNPDGTVTSHTWPGDITHVSTGVFTFTTDATVAGDFVAHWWATGAVATSPGDITWTYDAEFTNTTVSVDEFSTYINNPDLNRDRAQLILNLAQSLCESIVNPLPRGAEVVILDVAERAYAVPPEGVGPFGTITSGTMGGGGLFLTQSNIATLRRFAGRGGAFTIDTVPATAGQNLPWWDTGITVGGGDWDSPP